MTLFFVGFLTLAFAFAVRMMAGAGEAPPLALGAWCTTLACWLVAVRLDA